MKKCKKIILIACIIFTLYFIIDFICIFTLNKPLFAIKGNLPNQYLGLLYDAYNCPEYTVLQIKGKQSKFSCTEKTSINKVINIIDTTKTKKDFACAEALEQFFEDENYRYYYNCIKSKYIIVKYENGYEETVKEALKLGKITIKDLDIYSIDYIKYSKNNETLKDYKFIRTYNVLNVTESNDYDYLYLTVREFQGEEVVTVKVKRELAKNIEQNKNYEFTFKYINKELEDNIKSIFENTELINVVETDKIGLE